MTITDTETTAKPAIGQGKSRLLHTMIRVKDLDKSLRFYTDLLGMKLLRKRDYPTGKFTLAFVGYGEETDSTVVELTHNWDQKEPYALGSAFGHLAIGVPDVYKTCEALGAAGVKIPRPADLHVRILDHLGPLRDPADSARHREQHGEHRGWEAHRLQDDPGIEIDIRVQLSRDEVIVV